MISEWRRPNGGGLIYVRIGLPAMSHRYRNGAGLILVGIGLPATCRWGDGGIHDVSTWESRISPWSGWGTRPMCPNKCCIKCYIKRRRDPTQIRCKFGVRLPRNYAEHFDLIKIMAIRYGTMLSELNLIRYVTMIPFVIWGLG